MKCCIMSVLVMDNRARRICVQRTPPLQQRPGPRSPGQKTFADISYITYGRELAFRTARWRTGTQFCGVRCLQFASPVRVETPLTERLFGPSSFGSTGKLPHK